jgi:hypothetical protein
MVLPESVNLSVGCRGATMQGGNDAGGATMQWGQAEKGGKQRKGAGMNQRVVVGRVK